jgi:hypothetical protein
MFSASTDRSFQPLQGSCSAAHMAAPRTTTLNSMGDDVLEAIFLLLPPKDRCRFISSGRTCQTTVAILPRFCLQISTLVC